MKLLRKALALSVCASAIAFSGGATAGPIAAGDKVEVQNNVGSVFTPSPTSDSNGLYSNVTIYVAGTSQSVSAGMFVLDYREAGNPGSSWEQFLSFCLSPDVYLTPFDNPYTAFNLSSSPYSGSADRISEFWGRYRSLVINDMTAAAFQVGLWELAFEGGTNLASGSFRLLTTGSVFNTAQGWLSSLDGSGARATGLMVLVDNPGGTDRQDLLTQQVPEPGTLALLGIGFAGLALLRRRRTA